jgi:processive 1,2-diacylglycerol beta-glucosyltransferase
MTRVLILSASYGEGHNAAARSLLAAFDMVGGPGTARWLDPLAETSPRRDRCTRAVYYAVINRMPGVWNRFYRWLDRAQPLPGKLWLLQKQEDWLEALLDAEKPLAVCSTFPVFAFMLDHIAQKRGPRVLSYNVVTDSISINSMWWLAPCDGWFLPNQESRDVLQAAGCPEGRLRSTGFPVAPLFADPAQRFAVSPVGDTERPRVLVIVHSGSHQALETARLLLNETDWSLTFALGRDTSLRHRIEKIAHGRFAPVQIFGWTPRMPELLMTHHVVISKAGGATTQEAIAAHCPMMVNQVVPGQEEGNAELLRRHGIGGRAETPAEIIALLRDAFADGGRIWRSWYDRVQSLARPSAATDIAQYVLRRTEPALPSPASSPEPEISLNG